MSKFLRKPRLILFFIGLMLLSIHGPLRAEPTLIQNCIVALKKIGFKDTAITERHGDFKTVKFSTIRAQIDSRIYDINLLNPKEIYLAVSYDRGKKFGEAVKFSNLANVIETVQQMEIREKRRQALDPTAAEKSNNDDQEAGLTQKPGTADADDKKGKREEKKGASSDDFKGMAAGMGGAGASGGGGSAGAEDGGNAGAVMDKKTREFAGKFTGGYDPCVGALGGQSGGAVAGSAAGGVASVAQQVAEAAVATHVAERIMLAATGIGDVSGVGKGDQSKYFETGGGDSTKSIFDLAVAEREKALQLLLAQIVNEKDGAPTSQYDGVRAMYAKLKRRARNDGIKPEYLTNRMNRLIRAIKMDRAGFDRWQNVYPIEQRFGFFIETGEEEIIWLDPEAKDPEAAAGLFFTAAFLTLRLALMETFVQVRKAVAETNNNSWLAGDMPLFEGQSETSDKPDDEAFKKSESVSEAIIRLLANDPMKE